MVNKKSVTMQHASRLAAIPHNSLFPLSYDKNVIWSITIFIFFVMLQCGYINVTKIMVRILLVRIMKVKMNQRLAPEVFYSESGLQTIQKGKEKDPVRRAIFMII